MPIVCVASGKGAKFADVAVEDIIDTSVDTLRAELFRLGGAETTQPAQLTALSIEAGLHEVAAKIRRSAISVQRSRNTAIGCMRQ